MVLFRAFVVFIIAGVVLISCKKERYITSKDASLSTSSDTLFFDTVFTSVGSVTKSFKIFNNNSQKIRLSKVSLSGGATSFFKLNIDGATGPEASNIDIAANDSIYVFVQVNVNPNGGTIPFVISDSVLINYNGNNKYVQLQAYGQNANFIRSRVITGNVVFNNTLPYVILGGMQVGANSSLTLSPGVKIYCHADAPIIIDGTLTVNGTKSSPVIFKGDRLDADYKTLPAGWPGIFFRTNSKNNTMRFGQILNAYQGVVVQDPSVNSLPKLVMSQSIIDNSYSSGILADNSNLQVDNSLISNCGNDIIIQGGGKYKFTNCTVPAYSNIFITHKTPVLQVTDVSANVANDLNAAFVNCIFWGDDGIVKDEVVVLKQSSRIFSVTFDHVLMRVSSDPSNSVLNSIIKNQDPMFDSINTSKRLFDFHLTKNSTSPAVNSGTGTPFPKDLDDRPRNNGITDLGCYEK